MVEKRKIVTQIKHGERIENQDFQFDVAQVRLSDTNAYIRNYRQSAWNHFRSMQLPNTKEEAWRRTDLRNLKPGRFVINSDHRETYFNNIPERLLSPMLRGENAGSLTLSGNHSQISLKKRILEQGVIFTDLVDAEKRYPDQLEKILGKIINSGEDKFASLSAALAQNGVFIYIPKGLHLEQPLQSLIWEEGQNTASITHVAIYLDEDSSITYLQESASPEDETSIFHAGLVEICVSQGASLKFVELQSWGKNVWDFSHERIQVHRDANLEWIIGATGSRLTKAFMHVDLKDRGASGRVSGFSFLDGSQHIDYDTEQNHLAPNTTSDLFFKCALKDESRSIWQGMIYVAPGAEKTDGYQANRNLLLSPNARADSIPGLEILADDVRCSHGATIGSIDVDQIFYLMSRGIDRKSSEQLIVEGFFDPIMQRIPFESVRDRFQEIISKKMAD
jgi:Fe-S cluster assembly protein SufD